MHNSFPHKPARRQAGFSLVELMVSVVIGLLALLFATRLVVSGEQNKDAAVGGSDAMQNGMLALYSLSGDASTSGWGINDRTVAGCNTKLTDALGYQLLTVQSGGANVTPLASVVIQSNGANPDVISFNSGTSQSGVGSDIMNGDYRGENYITIGSGSPYGYQPGDVLVVAPATPSPSLPCTVIQFSSFNASPLDAQMVIATGAAYRFNAANSMVQNYNKSVTYVYNLGQATRLHLHTWSVNNGVLLLRASELTGAETAGVSVADNVVSIKAQYGFDTRALPNYDPNPPGNGTGLAASAGNGMQITQWSSVMVDADNDGVIGDPGDYQRIVAVRLAVVARSKAVQKPDSSGACDWTAVQPTVFGSAAPASVAPAPVQLNVVVPNDPMNWQCYRYRVFETIVPIINSQFRP